ncbi:MAG: sigma 54-interacting transcriptional regulator [Clostridiales Family XIII bacterium]|jgi:transcriptional regulator of acetoin/glycerol metabolism|nr:sigma 54-interacting transcriptional regulator [Clostridiales Family XIII bacterium]
MTAHTDGYQRGVAALWRRYVENGEEMPEAPPDGIRPAIYSSWRRSRANGVSPLEVKDRALESGELAAAIAMNAPLISVARSYIQNLYRFMGTSDFIIALTDSRGYVIELVGGGGLIGERAHRSALAIGCNRSERHAGTCGIGVALATGEPVQVWGFEHYIRPHHDYVCSAAPIRGKGGAIMAIMAAIGPGEDSTRHTLAMVCAAADGIEKEMEMREAYEKMFIINNQMGKALEAISSGIVMFDSLGIITQCNRGAARMLRLPYDEIAGSNIANVLDMGTCSADLLSMQGSVSNLEVSVANAAGARLSLSVSASIIRNEGGEKKSTVLVMDEQRRLNKMATRISGFIARYTFSDIIGGSSEFDEIRAMGAMAAQSGSNVLILGESGTGKDLLAQAIHNASARASAPFIAINCGSLPKGLVESELFGYERGAFTGAHKDGWPGKFELAEGGTVFLDEIGDMPIEMQASLLRVIQTREIMRIGGKASKPVDVRIIAATNRNLAALIDENRFRRDLYYRLNVLTFSLPPLRRHMSDLPALARHFISERCARAGMEARGISPGALDCMMRYAWPGNIRELENVIERALSLASEGFITERELGHEMLGRAGGVAGGGLADSPRSSARPGGARAPMGAGRGGAYDTIVAALKNERGNVTRASLRLGTPRRTLYRHIKKYGIEVGDFRLW